VNQRMLQYGITAGFVAAAIGACLEGVANGVSVATLIALPWITLCAVWLRRPNLTVGSKRETDVSLGIVGPGVALAYISLQGDIDAVGLVGPALMGLIGTILMTFAVVRISPDPMRGHASLLVLVVTAAAYGYGAGMQIDAQLDSSPPTTYAVRVLDKHVSAGRQAFRYITIEPWGSRTENSKERVSARLYDQTEIGGMSCVRLHRGAVRIPWYQLSGC